MTRPNPEIFLYNYLRSRPGLGAAIALDVPTPRPASLVTIELAGGSDGEVLSAPTLAVQCWADAGRYEASELARAVRSEVRRLITHSRVASVRTSGPYNFPSVDGVPRYQLVVDLVLL